MENQATKPWLAVTMGDPAGVGPEVACLAAVSPEVLEIARPVIVGDGAVIAEALQLLKIPAEAAVVNEIGEMLPGTGRVLVYQHGELDWPNLKKGQVSAAAGRASYGYVEKAVALAVQGRWAGW